jgi:hypothetical protein
MPLELGSNTFQDSDFFLKEGFSFSPVFQVERGPDVRTLWTNVPGTEKAGLVMRIEYTLIVEKPGRYVLDPLIFSLGEQRIETSPLLIEVAYAKGPLAVPFTVRWKELASPFYEGQAIPLVLKAEYLPAIKIPESIQVEPPPFGILETAPGLGDVEERRIGTISLFSIPVGSFMLTPSRPGRFQLPLARVRMDGMEQVSDEASFEVFPVPPQVRGSGGVGRFTVSTFLSSKSIVRGGAAELRVRIEGVGNLNYIRIPEPRCPGLNVSFLNRESHIVPTEEGYRGRVEGVFRVYAKDAGVHTIRIEPFWVWDPVEVKAVAISWPVLTLHVEETKIPIESKNPFPLEPIVSYSRLKLEWMEVLHGQTLFLLLFPALLGGAVSWIYLRKDPAQRVTASWIYCIAWVITLGVLIGIVLSSPSAPFLTLIEENPNYRSFLEQYHAGRVPEATDELESLITDYPEVSILHYNAGILHAKQAKKGLALFHLRKAVSLSPNRKFKAGLREAEKFFSPSYTVSIPNREPEFFFLLFIVGIHLLVLLMLFTKGSRYRSVGSRLLFALLVLVLGRTIYGISVRNIPWAVVASGNVVVRKVPSLSASGWIQVEEGSSFRVKATQGDFIYVYTEEGIEGWVEKKSLLLGKPIED